MSKSIRSVILSANTDTYTTKPVYQYDHGLTLLVSGAETEQVKQIHFSNVEAGVAVSYLVTQQENGAISSPIPDVLLAMDRDIDAYLYYEDSEEASSSSGYTVKKIRIPLNPRVKPEKITMQIPQMGPVNELAAELRELIKDVSEQGSGGGGTSELPDVSQTDNGKVLTVDNGQWTAKELPAYEGEYVVTPVAGGTTTLETEHRYMTRDVVVGEIPYRTEANESGGETIYIGTEA